MTVYLFARREQHFAGGGPLSLRVVSIHAPLKLIVHFMALAHKMHYDRTSHPFFRIRHAGGHFYPGVLTDPYAREREREGGLGSVRLLPLAW